MPSESAETLVLRARRGDTDAFSALVRRWTGPVHCIVLARVPDPRTAEDLVQITFLQAWRKLGQLREPAAFGGWLRQIARSACRDHARRLVARPQLTALPAVPVPAPPGDSPEQRVLTLEVRQTLHNRLQDLSESDRELVLLYHLEGRTTADLAAGLGLTEPAVRKRLSRARRSLSAGLASALATWLGNVQLGERFCVGVVAELAGVPVLGLSPTFVPRAASAAAALLAAAGLLMVAQTGLGSGSEPELERSALVVPAVTVPTRSTAVPAPAPDTTGGDAPSGAVLAVEGPNLEASLHAVFDTLKGHSTRWSALTVDCVDPEETCEVWLDVVDLGSVPGLLLQVSRGLEAQGIFLQQFRPLPPDVIEGNDLYRVGLFVSQQTMRAEPPPETDEPEGTRVLDRAEVEAFIDDWLTAVPDATEARVDCSGPPGICSIEVTVPEDICDTELLAMYQELSVEGYRVVGRALEPDYEVVVPDGMRRHSMELTVLEADEP